MSHKQHLILIYPIRNRRKKWYGEPEFALIGKAVPVGGPVQKE